MLVNNTVVCDHFKSIVAGGGQNGNNFARCHRGYNGGAIDDKAIDQFD